MKHQTAVNWLVDIISNKYNKNKKVHTAYIRQVIDKAKQMEKEQIINAWEDGKGAFSTRQPEQYYKEQYES